MTETGENGNWPQLRSGPLITGGVLAGAGAMLLLAGIAVGSSHVFAATRRWVGEWEVPPGELARQNWARARTAAAAGSAAWQNGRAAGQPAAHR
jgi:hypothetical protein